MLIKMVHVCDGDLGLIKILGVPLSDIITDFVLKLRKKHQKLKHMMTSDSFSLNMSYYT